ncbi:hypothetical protein [Entomohabitans teleogrylli]|uniref:hypothetical protein n=1 Tax=Entomohabitans teleogrylli TaxID=1384589 RepID=UPI00073D6409|nr:hypothetical protein [Entomohabitans teleogrylli]
MPVRIRGFEQARSNLDDIVKDIQGKKAVRALKVATGIIALHAAQYTPIGKTSTLINSLAQDVTARGTRITGRVIYSANYAVYVHEAPGVLKGKRRPASQGGGNYWDPSGEPEFLKKAAEETETEVRGAIAREMRL